MCLKTIGSTGLNLILSNHGLSSNNLNLKRKDFNSYEEEILLLLEHQTFGIQSLKILETQNL